MADANVTAATGGPNTPPAGLGADVGRQAFWLLYAGFVAAPILAGADKFLNLLARDGWEKYLTPLAPQITGLTAETFMDIVGVVEILAGIGVAVKPRIFAYVVAAWLLGIIINLFLVTNLPWLDIALRDLGLMLGALSLGRLAKVYGW